MIPTTDDCIKAKGRVSRDRSDKKKKSETHEEELGDHEDEGRGDDREETHGVAVDEEADHEGTGKVEHDEGVEADGEADLNRRRVESRSRVVLLDLFAVLGDLPRHLGLDLGRADAPPEVAHHRVLHRLDLAEQKVGVVGPHGERLGRPDEGRVLCRVKCDRSSELEEE
jgi:hypothetical protein